MDIQLGVEITGAVGIVGSILLLAFKAGKIVKSNENLGAEVRHLAASLTGHVMESDTRDKANSEAHADFRRAADMQAEAIKGSSKRLDRVETQSDATDRRADDLNARVRVLEDRYR